MWWQTAGSPGPVVFTGSIIWQQTKLLVGAWLRCYQSRSHGIKVTLWLINWFMFVSQENTTCQFVFSIKEKRKKNLIRRTTHNCLNRVILTDRHTLVNASVSMAAPRRCSVLTQNSTHTHTHTHTSLHLSGLINTSCCHNPLSVWHQFH